MDDSKVKEQFYMEFLKTINESKVQFIIGGGSAVRYYADAYRETKDIDVFCKAGDYPRLLQFLSKKGYETEIRDERWLAKASKKGQTADIIFASVTGLCAVDDSWFKGAPLTKMYDIKAHMITPEDLIWCKSYVQSRQWFDGADINHIILKQGQHLNWKRLLMRMEQHWEILLSHLLSFRFVYPSERGIVPKWLLEELLSRVHHQLELPIPQDKICRGRLISREQYETDVTKWKFKDIN